MAENNCFFLVRVAGNDLSFRINTAPCLKEGDYFMVAYDNYGPNVLEDGPVEIRGKEFYVIGVDHSTNPWTALAAFAPAED